MGLGPPLCGDKDMSASAAASFPVAECSDLQL